MSTAYERTGRGIRSSPEMQSADAVVDQGSSQMQLPAQAVPHIARHPLHS